MGLQALTQQSKIHLISARSMSKLVNEGAYGFVGQLHSVSAIPSYESTHTDIEQLLTSYQDLFQEPQSLPPRRSIEHKSSSSQMQYPKRCTPIVIIPNWVTNVQKSYEGDQELTAIIQAKVVRDSAYPSYTLQGGGHSGINGTLQRVKSMFYWPKMKDDVVQWVQNCDVCQRAKSENTPYPGVYPSKILGRETTQYLRSLSSGRTILRTTPHGKTTTTSFSGFQTSRLTPRDEGQLHQEEMLQPLQEEMITTVH
ncbi:hypothetical protein Salat_0685200 [Sesamum alatum]|uniref:Integrase zinc-binding domain-containing protein n=1 Tax=Sesamum alatum TaxID=300844 RepID=A0AAE1YS29_9LAMI|nr:hypothetical protein Salat_0685200 [Sesamum alatum]